MAPSTTSTQYYPKRCCHSVADAWGRCGIEGVEEMCSIVLDDHEIFSAREERFQVGNAFRRNADDHFVEVAIANCNHFT